MNRERLGEFAGRVWEKTMGNVFVISVCAGLMVASWFNQREQEKNERLMIRGQDRRGSQRLWSRFPVPRD